MRPFSRPSRRGRAAVAGTFFLVSFAVRAWALVATLPALLSLSSSPLAPGAPLVFGSWQLERQELKKLDRMLHLRRLADNASAGGPKKPQPKAFWNSNITIARAFVLIQEHFLTKKIKEIGEPKPPTMQDCLKAFEERLDKTRDRFGGTRKDVKAERKRPKLHFMLCAVEEIIPRLQKAHWFYQDNMVVRRPMDKSGISATSNYGLGSLPSMEFETFCEEAFERCPMLAPLRPKREALVEHFQKELSRAAVFGAICFNSNLTRVLMVRAYGCGSWTFPRGKVEGAEGPTKAAVRELIEETGIDIGHLIGNADFVQSQHGEKATRLYIVRLDEPSQENTNPVQELIHRFQNEMGIGASRSTESCGDGERDVGEIGGVKWVPFDELEATVQPKQVATTPYKSVLEFLSLVGDWRARQLGLDRRQKKGSRDASCEDPALRTIKRTLLGILTDDEHDERAKTSLSTLLEQAEDLLLFSSAPIPKRRYVCDSAHRQRALLDDLSKRVHRQISMSEMSWVRQAVRRMELGTKMIQSACVAYYILRVLEICDSTLADWFWTLLDPGFQDYFIEVHALIKKGKIDPIKLLPTELNFIDEILAECEKLTGVEDVVEATIKEATRKFGKLPPGMEQQIRDIHARFAANGVANLEKALGGGGRCRSRGAEENANDYGSNEYIGF